MNLDLFTVTPEEKPLDSLKGTCGFAGIFKEIGIIGDSLSSGSLSIMTKTATSFTMICMNIHGLRCWNGLREPYAIIIQGEE